ncbi:MAG: multifunctional CCA addition/repair protein [Gammaproteobacteria bacterium]
MNTETQETYLVGGAVRDALLGLPVHERDFVVVGATPAQMLSAGYKQVGKDFPVFLHPETAEEYALARTERKTGSGYTGFSVHAEPSVTLEEDLQRRDLTINAIARDANGQLVDPFGGARDLEDRVLRHVSPAFVEDPVRVLRAARFAARFAKQGFRFAAETMALMREMVTNGEIDALVPERVYAETVKAMRCERPSVYFETLRECGALARVFPEVDALFGVEQPAQWHPEIDTGVHTMMVIDQSARLSDAITVRFAALTHDLGKGETPKDMLPSHRGHEERSLPLVTNLCDRLRAPNDVRELSMLVAEHHTSIHRCEQAGASAIMRLFNKTDALRRPERFEEALLACEADARGRTGFEQSAYPQADHLRKLLSVVQKVRPGDLNLEGLKGPAIANRIHGARVSALKAVMPANADAD